MFCKVFFIHDGNVTSVKDALENIDEDHHIITDDEFLNRFLKKNNKKSSSLSELFNEISDKNNLINDLSDKELRKYKKNLSVVKYNQIGVFDGIENQLLEEIIFLEKIKILLNKKKNIVFLFSKFSISYFLIQKFAADLGYDIEPEFKIRSIEKGKNVLVSKNQNYKKFENKRKFSIVKNQIGITNTLKIASKLVARKTLQSRKHDLKSIFNDISKKISLDKSKQKECIGFFFTSDRIDFLKPFFSVISELKKNRRPYVIFTVDFMTKIILKREKIPFIDLSEVVYFLMEHLRNNNDVSRILKDFQKISNINQLSIVYNEQFSDLIKNEILKSISIIEIFDYIFKKNEFYSVGIAIDGSMFGNLICDISKKYSIPSFSIESYYINENLERKKLLKADRICVYGSQGYRALKKLNYDKKRLIITGNPIYDYIKKMNKSKARKVLGFKNGKKPQKIILIALGRWNENDEFWITKLIKFCNEQKISIFLKIHPRYKTWNRKESDRKIKVIKDNCENLDFAVSYDLDISTLVSAADLVITDFSNVGFEACLSNKSVITINFNNLDFSNVPQYHKFGLAINLKRYEELESCIMTLFKRESPQIADVSSFISEYNYLNDGKAANRICDLLINRKL